MKQKRTNRHDMSVQNIIRHINNGSMSLNHPLQRRAGQWDKKRKGNLIRRLLWGDDIQPIHICTQFDEYDCETEYVIDGKQRITSIQEYIDGAKAFMTIPATVTKPIITYTGVVYETKTLKNGAVRLVQKKNRQTKQHEFVPVLDENGNKQQRSLQFDIRGARFSQLPPELQEKLQEYMVPVLIKEDCTDDDIQQEIIDFNSGMPMCKEQKGVTKLGVNGMDKITKITTSHFIKDCCIFDESAEKKAKIERRVVESLCHLYLEYMKDYESMCELVSTDLLSAHVEDFLNMLDKLSEACVEESVQKYLGKKGGKELPVVISCFDYFRTLDYDISAFKMFIENWVDDLCNRQNIEVDGEFLSYAEKYKHSDTSPGVLQDRIEEMNSQLDNFLTQHCSDMKLEEAEPDELDEFDEFDELDQNDILVPDYENVLIDRICEDNKDNNINEDKGIDKRIKAFKDKALMVCSNYPNGDFDKSTVEKFKAYFADLSDEDKEELLIQTELDSSCIDDYLLEVPSESLLNSEDNILCLLSVLQWLRKERKELTDKEIDNIIKGWISQFADNILSDEVFAAITPDKDNYIMGRISYMFNSLERYMREDTLRQIWQPAS